MTSPRPKITTIILFRSHQHLLYHLRLDYAVQRAVVSQAVLGKRLICKVFRWFYLLYLKGRWGVQCRTFPSTFPSPGHSSHVAFRHLPLGKEFHLKDEMAGDSSDFEPFSSEPWTPSAFTAFTSSTFVSSNIFTSVFFTFHVLQKGYSDENLSQLHRLSGGSY